MTLVVDILARAARECSVAPPQSWLTATSPTALEILDFLDETRADIQDRLELTGPMSKSAVITGINLSSEHPLPADFRRLHRGQFAVYERFRTRRACVPVSDDGEWEYLKELGTAGAYRFYRITGYPGAHLIDFQRPLDPGLTAVVSYVTENWIVNGNTEKPAFTAADDQAMLPRKLLEKGVVMRFRRRKGLDYADVAAEYEALLGRYGNDSRTRRTISFGAVPARAPWDVPVPDVIPSA